MILENQPKQKIKALLKLAINEIDKRLNIINIIEYGSNQYFCNSKIILFY